MGISAKQLVDQSPFATQDGRLYVGRKTSVVHALDPFSGEVLVTFSDNTSLGGPVEQTSLPQGVVFVSRSDYKVTVHDSKTMREMWNFTFSEYSMAERYKTTAINGLDDYYRQNYLDNPLWYSQFSALPASIVVGTSSSSAFEVRRSSGAAPQFGSQIYVGAIQGNLYVLTSNHPQTFPTLDAGDPGTPGPEGPPLHESQRPQCVDETCLVGGIFSMQEMLPAGDPILDNRTVIPHPLTREANVSTESLPSPGSPTTEPKPFADFYVVSLLSSSLVVGVVATLYLRRASGPPAAALSILPPVAAPATVSADDEAEAQPPLLIHKSPKKSAHKKRKGKGAAEQAPAATANAETEEDAAVETTIAVEVSAEQLEEGWTRVGNLLVSDQKLGYGSHGTVVFLGRFENREVAVKRLLQEYYELAEREITLLQESDHHGNIIRYFCKEKNGEFLYIALEYCEASLEDLYEFATTPADPARSTLSRDLRRSGRELQELRKAMLEKVILRDLVIGVRHLHALNIVHRDLKPQNILVSRQRKVLISDFGLCKKLEGGRASYNTSAPGTVGWTAPEALQVHRAKRLTPKVDVFSLGCLFYYVITGGRHPFGSLHLRQANIVQGRSDLSALDNDMIAVDLISRMIAQRPEDRPDAQEILAHPFFWDDKRRLNFLHEASDKLEIEGKTSPPVLLLEAGALEVIGNNWCTRIDKVFLDSLGKFRKYQESSIRDLMRLIRNKKNHYEDLPEDVRQLLGPLPSGFLDYFSSRFPRLFLHTYRVIAHTPKFRQDPQFEDYF